MLTHLYTGKDEESHFEEITPAFRRDNGVERTALQGAKGITFNRMPAGHFIDWHPAPRRQYVIVLSGRAEIQIGDGTVCGFGPGGIFLAEDLMGRGHTLRVVSNQPLLFVAVPLGE